MDRRARERDARSGAHRRLVTARRLSLACPCRRSPDRHASSVACLRPGAQTCHSLRCSALRARLSISGHAGAAGRSHRQSRHALGRRGRKALAHVRWNQGHRLRHLPRRARAHEGCRHPLSRLRSRAAHTASTSRPASSGAASQHQEASPLAYESQQLLALTALVAQQSRGLPISVVVDGPMRPLLGSGRSLYYQQQGQLNLSCAQCHEEAWGKRLRAERISQGHPNGFPAYRLEWQTMGSLHRRLRACFQGVRAEPFASGSPELVALELFLAWRAQGLVIETPAVRR